MGDEIRGVGVAQAGSLRPSVAAAAAAAAATRNPSYCQRKGMGKSPWTHRLDSTRLDSWYFTEVAGACSPFPSAPSAPSGAVHTIRSQQETGLGGNQPRAFGRHSSGVSQANVVCAAVLFVAQMYYTMKEVYRSPLKIVCNHHIAARDTEKSSPLASFCAIGIPGTPNKRISPGGAMLPNG